MQMQKIPDLEKLDIKDITSYGGAKEHGEDRAKKHDKAASLYNHVRCPLHISGGIHDALPLWLSSRMYYRSNLLILKLMAPPVSSDILECAHAL